MHAKKDPDVVFRSTLYLMDIERVRFSLSRYLRTRLKKIELQFEYILSNLDAVERLSDQEKEFAFELRALHERYIQESVVDRLSNEQAMTGLDEMVKHAYPRLQVNQFEYFDMLQPDFCVPCRIMCSAKCTSV